MKERTNITVYSASESMTSKGAPFLSCDTSLGRVTVFDEDAMTDIENNINVNLDVDIMTNGKFRSIARVYGIASKAPAGVPNANPLVAKPAGDKSKEIRAAVAFKGAVELCAAGKIDLAQLKEFSLTFIEVLKELEK